MPILLVAGASSLFGFLVCEVLGHWQSGLKPTETAYAAIVYMASFLSGQIVVAVAIMSMFTVIRYLTGRLNSERRATFDNTALLALYAAAQGLLGLLLVHGFPRLAG
jgi:cytochrome c oxidase subunit I+III